MKQRNPEGSKPHEGFGWCERSDGMLTHTEPGYGCKAPEREGWKCFFVGHFGQDYTRWTYRRVQEV
jgi:hypothetical protein